MRRAARWLALCLAVCALAACDSGNQRRELRGGTMGTTWSVVYADPGHIDPRSLRGSIESELEALNGALSTYLPDSEISRLNEAAETAETTLSPRFAAVLETALAISAATDGAYDVTVGPLVDLWGFGAGAGRDRVPAAAEIEAALARVGVGRIDWDPSSAVLRKPAGVRIDLSSIAKGYAVDRLAALLAAAGLEDFLVEIGGELRVQGERPGGGPWRLAIESPRPSAGRVIDALALTSGAVATSGDYRNYFEVDGQRYSHLVDPRSGYPVAHELVSVTVVHEDCMQADAWATALIVLGREAAMATARREGLAAYFVSRDGDQLTVDYTDSFAGYLAAQQGDSGSPGA